MQKIKHGFVVFAEKKNKMREDFQEKLDKMFPEGYVIVYTFKKEDDILRVSHYNPHGYKGINQIRQLIDEFDNE